MTDTVASNHMKQTIKKIGRDVDHLIVDTLRLRDTNGDGLLSAAEAEKYIHVQKQVAPQAPGTAPEAPSFGSALPPLTQLPNYLVPHENHIENDGIVFDRSTLLSSVQKTYNLSSERIDRLITKAFPKGVATVTIGQLCTDRPELECMPLANGKILHTKPGPTI